LREKFEGEFARIFIHFFEGGDGMTDVNSVARAELRSFIERIERLEEEKSAISGDIKDVKGEAKGRGYDVGAINTIIRLRKKDANERAEEEAVLDTYMAALGMIPEPTLFDEPHDRETGELSPRLAKQVVDGMQTEAGRAALMVAVDIMIDREEAEEQNSPEAATRPGQDVQSPSQRAMAGENLDVTGGESAAAVERDAEATVEQRSTATNYRSDGGLNIVHKHTEIASASQGEAEAPSVERISPAETNTGSADANIGGDHEVADTHSFAAQAGASVQGAPAKLLRPHCRNPQMCGSGTIDHCHSCKVAMREREVA